MTLVAAAGALLVGLTLGLLGGGGAIVTVPVLVYAMGLDAKLAVVMALSARTRRVVMPSVEIELDVFGPDGTRAVRLQLGQ